MVGTTFCTSGAVLAKAGAKVSPRISGALLKVGADDAVDTWITQAEGTINALARYNFTDNYASLNVDVKKILEDISSNLAAIYAIQYDFSTYTSRVEAEDMINILRDAALRGLSILRDKKTQDFLNGA